MKPTKAWYAMVKGLTFRHRVRFTDDYGRAMTDEVPCDMKDAEVVCSVMKERDSRGKLQHKLLLDLDHNALLVPSSTEGHFHLYVDVTIGHWRYKRLLKQLAKAGVIEPGYAAASRARGHSDPRVPWVKK